MAKLDFGPGILPQFETWLKCHDWK